MKANNADHIEDKISSNNFKIIIKTEKTNANDEKDLETKMEESVTKNLNNLINFAEESGKQIKDFEKQISTENKESDFDYELDSNDYHAFNNENDPEEYKHLKSIVSAFYNYRIDSLREISKMERDFSTINEKHKSYLMFDYSKRFDQLKACVLKNYFFLLKIIEPYSYMFKCQRNVKVCLKIGTKSTNNGKHRGIDERYNKNEKYFKTLC